MSVLDHEIRRGLERLSDPNKSSDPLTFDKLAARRRQRRLRNAALAVVPIVVLLALVAGAMSTDPDDGTTVAAGGDDDASFPPATSPAITVKRTEVVGSDGGTARVVMEFDRPVPTGVRYVEDITSLEVGDEIVYTTQEARRVHVCGSVHSFPPPAEGTVDVLIPVDWFAEGENTHTSPLETIANPAKFIVCGHGGYFQYSIWGPASADVADVHVAVDHHGTRLTVQIDPQPNS